MRDYVIVKSFRCLITPFELIDVKKVTVFSIRRENCKINRIYIYLGSPDFLLVAYENQSHEKIHFNPRFSFNFPT